MRGLAAMKHINLTQGKIAIVDDEDFDDLSKFKWHALRQRDGSFCACRMSGRPKRQRVYMHRQILCVVDRQFFVDHKNHNPLDNRRSNIRIATPAQNRHNSRPNNVKKTSKFLGVSWSKEHKSFRVALSINGKQQIIARSADEVEAAKLYNEAARKHYGEFAYINKI